MAGNSTAYLWFVWLVAQKKKGLTVVGIGQGSTQSHAMPCLRSAAMIRGARYRRITAVYFYLKR
jgi:hypothetical protein